jgi:hypothetical protein
MDGDTTELVRNGGEGRPNSRGIAYGLLTLSEGVGGQVKFEFAAAVEGIPPLLLQKMWGYLAE